MKRVSSKPATQRDLANLRDELGARIDQSEQSLRGEFGTLRGEFGTLRGEFGTLRDEFHLLGVRFESLESKMALFGEGLIGLREHVSVELKQLETRLTGRIGVLEDVVRQNSAGIRDVAVEVADLRARFDRRDDLRELDRRVSALEKRLLPRR